MEATLLDPTAGDAPTELGVKSKPSGQEGLPLETDADHLFIFHSSIRSLFIFT